MVKWIKILIAGIFVSFYFFPFEFTFLPGVNTKMAMAGVGLVWFVMELAKGRTPQIKMDGFHITIMAIVVSLCALSSVIINNTNDGSYVTYVVSMLVWLGGAYTAVGVVRLVHGCVSVSIICNYLIGVCVGQCALAMAMNTVPEFKSVVDSYVVGFDFVNTETLTKANRLYGIGAGLDVAGTRFAAVLVMIAILIKHMSMSRDKSGMWVYFVAFVIISVIGNMMARTTTVGAMVALSYWVLSSKLFDDASFSGTMRLWRRLLSVVCILLPLIVYLYTVDQQFHDNIRFAFEGFFSLAEKGHWETNSNNILKNMIVFPDNAKTWIIGDGYLLNPSSIDPYYVGPIYKGFYKGTDIGYIRFIFYFGLVGLVSFVCYFFQVAKSCMKRFPKYSTMFMLILTINMIVWFKVSTDIFLVFALFLCISKEENDAYENEYEDSIPDSLDV